MKQKLSSHILHSIQWKIYRCYTALTEKYKYVVVEWYIRVDNKLGGM